MAGAIVTFGEQPAEGDDRHGGDHGEHRVGFGLTMAPSFATATQGVAPSDAGVASAMVNTSQGLGGTVGLV